MSLKWLWEADREETRREYAIWINILYRGKRNGTNVSKLFKDFDSWLSWSRCQKGFMCFDTGGNIFQSESDLLSFGSKTYSEDTVLYVPNSVNQLCKPSSKFGGIQYQSGKVKPYRSYISKFGKSTGLGYSSTVEEAYEKSRVARVEYIKELEDIYKDCTDNRVWENLLSDYWTPRYFTGFQQNGKSF